MNSVVACPICTTPKHQQAKFCKLCKKLIDRLDSRRSADKEARIRALTKAWDGQHFRCYYSGVRLVTHDHRNPRYVTFDHRVPRQESDIVICAAAINDMKSDLDEEEFRTVVIDLAKRFQGGEFDENALNLKHWKR